MSKKDKATPTDLQHAFPYPPDPYLMRSAEGDSKAFRRKQRAVYDIAKSIIEANPNGPQAAWQRRIDENCRALGLPVGAEALRTGPDKSPILRRWLWRILGPRSRRE